MIAARLGTEGRLLRLREKHQTKVGRPLVLSGGTLKENLALFTRPQGPSSASNCISASATYDFLCLLQLQHPGECTCWV
jgi:hypothetical protein